MIAEAASKPHLRGVLHQYAFFLSLIAGAALVSIASGEKEVASSAVFAAALAVMFGTSAVYHRGSWRPRARRVMRRLDHAAIYLLVAGTYTPFGLLVLSGPWQVAVLSIVWSGCLVATLVKLAWIDSPKWVAAAFAIALGWVGVIAMPQLVSRAGLGVVTLLMAGGGFYTIGAVVYARGRPDPLPTIFGYHEIFHAFVIAAAGCQYAAVALVLARA